MISSRRDFLLRSGLVSLSGTGLLISACGGGGRDDDPAVSTAPMTIAECKRQMRDINGQFKIGRTEVTVGMFREYCQIVGKQMPTAPSWGWKNSYPMVLVTWSECNAYADWAGLRLPTVEEWELAASGGDGRNYPWGGYGEGELAGSWPGWDPARCVNSVGTLRKSPAPVGSISAGDSPFGCSDMAGNASEWCADRTQFGSAEDRGGAWNFDYEDTFRCASGGLLGTDDRYDYVGFRLAAGPG